MGRIKIEDLGRKDLNPSFSKSAIVELKISLQTNTENAPSHSEKNTTFKSEVDNRLQRKFKRVVDDLGQCYMLGTTEYICTVHPALYSRLERQDNLLNVVWAGCLSGFHKTSLFDDVLKRWHSLHRQSVELYKKHYEIMKAVGEIE
jgi:hypothetical protein